MLNYNNSEIMHYKTLLHAVAIKCIILTVSETIWERITRYEVEYVLGFDQAIPLI